MTPLPVKELERLADNLVSTMSQRSNEDLDRIVESLDRLVPHLLLERRYRSHRADGA